jgi:hypothetical protein
MNRESPKAVQTADSAFTSREIVERIVNEAIADGAFDQALRERQQEIADPECRCGLDAETAHRIRKSVLGVNQQDPT